jgi:cytochrome c oxidase assembly protein subunit 15
LEKVIRILTLISLLLVIVVVTLGAYVRLSDAGLGCPDWPGCYGHMTVPKTPDAIKKANEAFKDHKRPVEQHKAWKEMVHRYFAGTLGILIFFILLLSLIQAIVASIKKGVTKPNWKRVGLVTLLSLLVVFQAALGMWTVTIKLMPIIVTAHLLMGFATLVFLGLLYYSTRIQEGPTNIGGALKFFLMLGIIVLVVQIFLGGWTSSNYAALSCTDFPACSAGKWLPQHDFKKAFTLWSEFGENHEFGKLKPDARMAIHMSHRVGAVLTLILLLLVGLLVFIKTRHKQVARLSAAMMVLVALQFALGAFNILFSLPLLNAVAHNGVAAILLLTCLCLYLHLRRKPV